jgi:hypothetical protein
MTKIKRYSQITLYRLITSFHWLQGHATLSTIFHALKPGGWWLACWHTFNDPWVEEDHFRMETALLFAEVNRVQQDDCKRFGGNVTRPVLTSYYMARRPL